MSDKLSRNNFLHKRYVDSNERLNIVYSFMIILIAYNWIKILLRIQFKWGIISYFLIIFLMPIFIIIITKIFFKLKNDFTYRIVFSYYLKKFVVLVLISILSILSNNQFIINLLFLFIILYILKKSDSTKKIYYKIKRKLRINENINRVGIIHFIKNVFIIIILFIIITLIFFEQFLNIYALGLIRLLSFILLIIVLLIEFFVSPSEVIVLNFKYTGSSSKHIGISFEDVVTSKINFGRKLFKYKNNRRLVKIQLNEIFSNFDLKINNQYYTNTHLYVNRFKNYVYFCIDDKTRQCKKLNFILDDGKRKYKLVVFISIKSVDNNLIISDYQIVSFRRVFKIFYKDGIEEYVLPQDILSTLRYCYKYNYTYDISEELRLNVTHDSSWLFHNGAYGSGKSSLDLLSILESNYKPVVISPWENNYDVDFLYLVYQKTKSCCKGKGLSINIIPRLKSPTNIIFYTTIFSVSMLIYQFFGVFINHIIILVYNVVFRNDKTIIYIKGFIKSILTYSDNIHLKDLIPISSFAIIAIFTGGIIKRFLPGIIIYFKDSTKIHQYYYIERILDMIRNHNLLLVIEDIDRMSKDGIEDVLRVCSCLNREYTNRTNPLGIISMDEKILIESGKLSKKEFEDLRNKVFSKEIFKKYNEKESILLYLKDYCNVAYKLLNTSQIDSNRKQIEILEFLNKCDLKEKHIIGNFRDLHKMLDSLIYSSNVNIDTLKDEIKKLIKIPVKHKYEAYKVFKL